MSGLGSNKGRVVKIAFYKGTRAGWAGLYNRLVRWFERGKYSHCELVFSDGISASSSFLDGGVRFKRIEYDPARWDFVDVPDAMELRARLWFTNHKGAKYDVMGNVRFFFGWMPDNPNKWFCSEAVAAALAMPDPWRYGPNLLWASLQEKIK